MDVAPEFLIGDTEYHSDDQTTTQIKEMTIFKRVDGNDNYAIFFTPDMLGGDVYDTVLTNYISIA